MDKKEAIALLKEHLGGIIHLAKLPPENYDYPLWFNTLKLILEEVFGQESSEYKEFTNIPPLYGANIPARQQYLHKLKSNETAILSIIRKHEILGMEGGGNKGGEVEKMDKKRAIGLLKQYLDEIPELRTLPDDNQEYELWKSKIVNVIHAGLEQTDEDTFVSARYESNVLPQIGPGDYGKPRSKYYQENITAKETALKSIIEKHEILGTEEISKVIEVPPEDVLRVVPPKAFISHGKESVALRKLKEFIETLGIEPLIVKKQASLDKDLPDKINLYLGQAEFVIILATGDDEFEGKRHPRQNVIHEIGLAQKTHPGKIIYLLEEGAEFPSNIRPKVWESFKQRNMLDAFLGIVRELRAYGILQVTKYPIKEQT